MGVLLIILMVAAQDEVPPARPTRVPVESRAPAEQEDARAERPARVDEGLHPLAIGALQLAAACGTYLVAVPTLSMSSSVCPIASCGLCLAPAAAGYAGTWIGDRFGQGRAPAVWPIIAAYGGLVLSALGAAVLYYGALTGGQVQFVLGGAAGVLAGVTASALGVPIAYAFTAEEKRPGDDGEGLPGLLEPGHQGPVRKKKPSDDGTSPRSKPPAPPLPDLPPPPPLLDPQGALPAMRF